uniref:Uncharacterized protein n=1 Tax=Rhizophora mucronata TaxID=61149 RepID=A0A2P2NXU9_RHIMU
MSLPSHTGVKISKQV